MLLPERRPVIPQVAQGYLESLPKPVSVVAVSINATMALGVWPAPPTLGIKQDIIAMVRETFDEAARKIRPKGAVDILVRGRGVAVPLSIDECERWLQDYDLPTVSLAIGHSSSDLSALCIVHVSSSSDSDGFLDTHAR